MRFLLLLISSVILVACGQHSQKNAGMLAGSGEQRISTATGEEAVILAINSSDLAKIREMVPSSWPLDKNFKSGRNLLTESCYLKKFAVVELLMSLGADPALVDQEGRSGGDYATTDAQLRRLLFPLERIKQEMELMQLVRANKFNDVKRLLTNGVDPNFLMDAQRRALEVEETYLGSTPLTLSVELNLGNVVRVLLAPNSATNVNLPNERGETALRIARTRGLTQIERMLLQRGATEGSSHE